MNRPPPPKRGPSPRRVAAAKRNSSLRQAVNLPAASSFPIRMGGAASTAQELTLLKDDMNDVAVAMVNCADTLQAIQAFRMRERSSLAANSQGAGRAPAFSAALAHDFCVARLVEMERSEKEEDRAHSQMPEMSRVLGEIEKGRRDRLLQQQQQNVQQQWQTTSGRSAAAAIGYSHSAAGASPPPMLNPYSVGPRPQTAAAFYGVGGGAPGAAGRPGASPARPGYPPPSAPYYSPPPPQLSPMPGPYAVKPSPPYGFSPSPQPSPGRYSPGMNTYRPNVPPYGRGQPSWPAPPQPQQVRPAPMPAYGGGGPYSQPPQAGGYPQQNSNAGGGFGFRPL